MIRAIIPLTSTRCPTRGLRCYRCSVSGLRRVSTASAAIWSLWCLESSGTGRFLKSRRIIPRLSLSVKYMMSMPIVLSSTIVVSIISMTRSISTILSLVSRDITCLPHSLPPAGNVSRASATGCSTSWKIMTRCASPLASLPTIPPRWSPSWW